MKQIIFILSVLLCTFHHSCTESSKMETEKVKLEISSTLGGEALGAGNYELASTVELKALPIEGYVFVHWQDESGNILSTNAYHTFTINTDTKVLATFAIKKFSVRLSTTGDGIGTVSGAGEYDLSSTVPVEAVAGANSVFVAWLDKDENVVSTLYSHVFVIEKDTELIAKFEIIKHSITATTNGGGTVSGTGKYTHGSIVTLKVTPYEGYKFVKWTNKEGATLSTSTNYSFTANGDNSVVCIFERIVYIVKFYSNAYNFTLYLNGGTPIVWGKSYSFFYEETIHLQSDKQLEIVNCVYKEIPNHNDEYDYYIDVKRNMDISIKL